MDLMSMASGLIKDKLGDSLDSSSVISGLQGLLGGSDGNLDIAGLVSKVAQGGLGDTLSSWLGDGENLPIDKDTISKLFDSEQLGAFASKLGIDANSAKDVLSNAIPNLVDKSSSGGSLLDGIGDLGSLGGLGDLAKKFF